jgi:penicillin G amidase
LQAVRLDGLQSAARLIQDSNGVTHIEAASLHDLFFLQGWVHARDRLFQMDVSRREPSGTLAELLGRRSATTWAASWSLPPRPMACHRRR